VEKIQQVCIRGTPDFLCCISGVFVAIELKMPGESPDPLQYYKLTTIAKTGGIAIVLSPENFDKTLEFLKDIAFQAQDLYAQNEIIQ
jgi:hypothetical protein